jgi:hypothetical protein
MQQLLYKLENISSEILSGIIRVFFSEVLKKQTCRKVKFQPWVSANLALSTGPSTPAVVYCRKAIGQ